MYLDNGQITHPQHSTKRKRLLITGIHPDTHAKNYSYKKPFANCCMSRKKINARSYYRKACHVQKKRETAR